MKRILIAGKDSYIGTSLIRFITANHMPCEAVELDVRDPTWKSFDLCGFEAVLLVAGIVHRKEDNKNTKEYYLVNRNLAYDIAKWAKSAGVHQFIMISTMSVYGIDEGIITPYTEPSPSTNYGKSKLQGENLIRLLEDESFTVTILRPPMVYGSGCKGNFNVLLKIARTLPVFPKVKNRRSAIYIDNLCAFILMCLANGDRGTFFPQDERYMNTSSAVMVLASAFGKKMRLLPVLGAFITFVRPYTGVTRKAFGTLIYEGTDVHDFSYCVVPQHLAISMSSERSDYY